MPEFTDSFTKLHNDIANCQKCSLCKTRTNIVIGSGCESCKLMLVGEGPGEQEDLSGEPFVGPAGQLLDNMLELIDIDRSKIYIANTVKCRPPHNRDPLPEERQACLPWLNRQIDLVQPLIIVCLGRVAAKQLIDDSIRISEHHGRWFEVNNTLYMPTFHPSYLLRDPSKRPEAFGDLVSLRSKMANLGIIL